MADLDKLAKAYAEDDSKANKAALWRAAFGLDTWYCIACGPMEKTYPFIASVKPPNKSILVFSSDLRAANFALRNALHPETVDTIMMHIKTEEAVDYFLKFQEFGVDSVVFNSGYEDFIASLDDLAEMEADLSEKRSS